MFIFSFSILNVTSREGNIYMDENVEGDTVFPLSSSSVGKSLNVQQCANISKTYEDIAFPMNLNFDLEPSSISITQFAKVMTASVDNESPVR